MTDNVFEKILSSETFREEHFVDEVQARLSELMEDQGMSRAELARRLDVSRARVTQIFSDSCTNFTVRLLVRSFLALGEAPVILARSQYDQLLAGQNQERPSNEASVDGLTEAVIANLLRATIGERSLDSDRPKRVSDAKDWASAGPNVVPIREKAHG